MTNKFRFVLAVSALAVSAAAVPMFGADTDPMRISVPFSFKAGNTTLPAGDYVVLEENSGIIMIKGNGGHSAIVLSSTGAESNTEKASLSFAKGDQGYVLKSVHNWGRISSNILPIAPSQEK